MDWMYLLVLAGAGLILLSVLTSVVAFRFGAPLLLVFLCIGLVAGGDGLGLIQTETETTYFVCSLALAVILFDAGFSTRMQSLRRAAAPAIVLASLGVLLTTLLVGVGARFLLDLSWPKAFLVGAVVSSTDAAAVFFLLRARGVKIYKRVRAILEIESGSNDPMAIFLTIFFIELVLSAGNAPHWAHAFISGFAVQMGLGALIGVVAGYLIVTLVNSLHLDEALYPIAVMAAAMSVFALTGYLGGSGFLAVYVAGIVSGNQGMKGSATLRRYQNGMTWLAQIVMFLLLGLVVTPSEFGPVLLPAIALAVFMTVIGRPIAVWLCLLPFRYDRRSVAFTSWVGLRGAVSIMLGMLPALNMLDDAYLYLHVAFIMVVTSLLLQGWTVRFAAQKLNLVVPPQIGPVRRIELELPDNPNHELVVYQVMEGSAVLGDPELPRWARPALVVRRGASLDYERAWPLQAGDQVYVMLPPHYVRLLDRLFAQPRPPRADDKEYFGEFRIDPKARLGDLLDAYNIPPRGLPVDETVGRFLRKQFRGPPVVGDRIAIGPADLVVCAVHRGGLITDVGLSLHHKHSERSDRGRA